AARTHWSRPARSPTPGRGPRTGCSRHHEAAHRWTRVSPESERGASPGGHRRRRAPLSRLADARSIVPVPPNRTGGSKWRHAAGWYDREIMLAVDARDLLKTFRSGWFGRRRTAALRGATLQVPRGAIFGLLGPNGAGKTTLLSILATVLLPDGGSASVLGHDVVREPFAVRRRLNMASGNASFVWSLRPAEVLAFYGRLYGLSGSRLRQRVEELIERCELGPHRKTEYNELSTGLKQRLAFAKALINEPDVLFLDEPTLGLDPDVSIRIRAQVAELRRERGTTIILTTHYMREAEELCDTIAFIKGGRILAQGSADELKRRVRIGDVIALRLDPGPPENLEELPGILHLAARGETTECTVDSSDKRLPEILRWLHEQGVLVRDCQVREPELEEVFVELAR